MIGCTSKGSRYYEDVEFAWKKIGWDKNLEKKRMIFDTINSSLIYMAIKRKYEFVIVIDDKWYKERMTKRGRDFISYLYKHGRIIEREEDLIKVIRKWKEGGII